MSMNTSAIQPRRRSFGENARHPRATAAGPTALLVIALALSACDGAVFEPVGASTLAENEIRAGNRLSDVNAQVAAIHELQSAFHGALRNSDSDAIRSLWTDDATLRVGATFASGPASIAAFFESSPPFVNGWAALAPTYKTRVEIHGNRADYAFECVYVAETGNLAGQTVLAHLNATGSMRKVGDRWLFEHFQGGVGPLP